MITSELWQAEEGPRWLIKVGYRDSLNPDQLYSLCREGFTTWEIHKTILIWYLRDGVMKAEFAFDMRRVFLNAGFVLEQMASSMARSATRKGISHHLPLQFFGGKPPVLTADGLPIPGEAASDELKNVSPVDPRWKPMLIDIGTEMEALERSLVDGTKKLH